MYRPAIGGAAIGISCREVGKDIRWPGCRLERRVDIIAVERLRRGWSRVTQVSVPLEVQAAGVSCRRPGFSQPPLFGPECVVLDGIEIFVAIVQALQIVIEEAQ